MLTFKCMLQINEYETFISFYGSAVLTLILTLWEFRNLFSVSWHLSLH